MIYRRICEYEGCDVPPIEVSDRKDTGQNGVEFIEGASTHEAPAPRRFMHTERAARYFAEQQHDARSV
jgi:hypothetical protein